VRVMVIALRQILCRRCRIGFVIGRLRIISLLKALLGVQRAARQKAPLSTLDRATPPALSLRA
jgi:hypothetical protein